MSDLFLTLDLQAKNILLRIQDQTVLRDAEEAEIKYPSASKVTEEATIFATRDLPGPLRRWIGGKSEPVLCDFGEARTGNVSYTELIQPAVYRSPEVFLHLPWGTPVDIWNLGSMVRLLITIFSSYSHPTNIAMEPCLRSTPLLTERCDR